MEKNFTTRFYRFKEGPTTYYTVEISSLGGTTELIFENSDDAHMIEQDIMHKVIEVSQFTKKTKGN